MGLITDRLKELDVSLPNPLQVPNGLELPFAWVRVSGDRAYIAGHLPTTPSGLVAEPCGKVGAAVTLDEATQSARLAALAVLGSLDRELGDLDRVHKWLRVFGMVNCAPGFNKTTAIVNGFSQVIIDVYGRERGLHARAAVGVAELPFDSPVEFEAEVEICG